MHELLCITTTWNHQNWGFHDNVSMQLRICHSLFLLIDTSEQHTATDLINYAYYPAGFVWSNSCLKGTSFIHKVIVRSSKGMNSKTLQRNKFAQDITKILRRKGVKLTFVFGAHDFLWVSCCWHRYWNAPIAATTWNFYSKRTDCKW